MGEVSRPQLLVPGQAVTLRCLVSGFYPGQVAVTWLRKGAGEREPRPVDGSDTHSIHTPAPSRAPDGKSYSVESELHFTPSGPEDDGVEYQCRVEHETLQKTTSKSTGPLPLRVQPQLSHIHVLPDGKAPQKTLFAVRIENFYPQHIQQIQWKVDGKAWERSKPSEIIPNPDGTFTATSVWRVPSRSLTGPGLRVRVSVKHNPGDIPMERELCLGDAGQSAPTTQVAAHEPPAP
ncbi:hypothetical protein Y1Q_0023911 [Alligator mississippiensis]|uniref:Ig-like domain-containing protein n=1 Tax=Alligator mississippiensis TaxID=8496 RepID=A0A151MUD3_ALLMI|nr:hypothetical protein Y1Q_0023911 [Alligator mississippiensis]